MGLARVPAGAGRQGRLRGPAGPFVAFACFTLAAPRAARAYCDGMDGPVVQAARKALESGNVNLVLIGVQPQSEAEIKAAFQKTLAVRKLNPQAQELADRYLLRGVNT